MITIQQLYHFVYKSPYHGICVITIVYNLPKRIHRIGINWNRIISIETIAFISIPNTRCIPMEYAPTPDAISWAFTSLLATLQRQSLQIDSMHKGDMHILFVEFHDHRRKRMYLWDT